uniref:Uncharacterized protein n=1 Tax=viral metagenome TaxID=1070528 RepID=A0A6C0AUE4_9ZZZZ
MAADALQRLAAARPAWLDTVPAPAQRAAAARAAEPLDAVPRAQYAALEARVDAVERQHEAQHAALEARVEAVERQNNALRVALLQMQQHVQHAVREAAAAQKSVVALRKALQPVRTDVDSLQRQVGEGKHAGDARHAATHEQLGAAARMMAVVYPEFVSEGAAGDDFTKRVAREMQRLAAQDSDSE